MRFIFSAAEPASASVGPAGAQQPGGGSGAYTTVGSAAGPHGPDNTLAGLEPPPLASAPPLNVYGAPPQMGYSAVSKTADLAPVVVVEATAVPYDGAYCYEDTQMVVADAVVGSANV